MRHVDNLFEQQQLRRVCPQPRSNQYAVEFSRRKGVCNHLLGGCPRREQVTFDNHSHAFAAVRAERLCRIERDPETNNQDVRHPRMPDRCQLQARTYSRLGEPRSIVSELLGRPAHASPRLTIYVLAAQIPLYCLSPFAGGARHAPLSIDEWPGNARSAKLIRIQMRQVTGPPAAWHSSPRSCTRLPCLGHRGYARTQGLGWRRIWRGTYVPPPARRWPCLARPHRSGRCRDADPLAQRRES